jgi:hypothetical protein
MAFTKYFGRRGDGGKHKMEAQARKARTLYSRETQPETSRPPRDYPETWPNGQESSGNGGLAEDSSHKERPNKPKKPKKSKRLPNFISRKPVPVYSNPDRDTRRPRPRDRDDIETNKDLPPVGNTRVESSLDSPSRHRVVDVSSDSRPLPATPEDENMRSGSRSRDDMGLSDNDPPSGNNRGRLSLDSHGSSRAANVSDINGLSPANSEDSRIRPGSQNQDIISSNESHLPNANVPNESGLDADGRPRDADVDETSEPLQGEESHRTETRHEKDDSGSRAIRTRISRCLHQLKIELPSIVSTHFDTEILRSCSLENIEMAINGLIQALRSSSQDAHDTKKALGMKTADCESLTKSRDEWVQKKKELEDRLSTLERDKEKEKEIWVETTVSVLRAEYKKAREEQQSAWNTKEDDYTLQLHNHEEAAKQLKQQYQKQMKMLLEEHQSKWKKMEDGYSFRIRQLENEIETWENTYEGKVAELDQRHQTQIIMLQRNRDERIAKVQSDCNNSVSQLENEIELLKNYFKSRIAELEQQHQDQMFIVQRDAEGKIAMKERDCNHQVLQSEASLRAKQNQCEMEKKEMAAKYHNDKAALERNLQTTKNNLYSQINAMGERHDQEMKERAREIAQIKEDHKAQKTQMRDSHEAQQKQMRDANEVQQKQTRDAHNSRIVALQKKHEEEHRSLRERVESLKEALVKGDRFKAMTDRELARRFQDLTSDVDTFARFRWDDGRVQTWPFPNKVFLNSENQRRDKQYLFQNTIWVILYERIFCTPFRVLGNEGTSLEQQWMANFGQGELLV